MLYKAEIPEIGGHGMVAYHTDKNTAMENLLVLFTIWKDKLPHTWPFAKNFRRAYEYFGGSLCRCYSGWTGASGQEDVVDDSFFFKNNKMLSRHSPHPRRKANDL